MQPAGPVRCQPDSFGGMTCHPVDPDREEAAGMFCGLVVALFLVVVLLAFLSDRCKRWRLARFTRQRAERVTYDPSPLHRYVEGDRVAQPPPTPSASPGAGMRDVRLSVPTARRGEVLGPGGVEGGRVTSLVRWDDGATDVVDEASIVHEAMYQGE